MRDSFFSGYAMDDQGILLHIKDAKRGFSHNYKCPVCNKTLGARKGDTNEHHFAHKAGETHEGESVLHYVAKHRLAKMIKECSFTFFLKTRFVIFDEDDFQINPNYRDVLSLENVARELEVITPEALSFNSVEVERSVSNELRPDVLCETSDKDRFAVEVFVTNSKKDEQLTKYKDEGVLCLEIDLSKLPFNAEVEAIDEALNDLSNHKWLNFTIELNCIKKAKAKFLSSTEVLSFINKMKEKKSTNINKSLLTNDPQEGVVLDAEERPLTSEEFLEEKKEKRLKSLLAQIESNEEKEQEEEKEVKPRKVVPPQKTQIIRNKTKVEKKIKVKFVETYGAYRAGMQTELKASEAIELQKNFIVQLV